MQNKTRSNTILIFVLKVIIVVIKDCDKRTKMISMNMNLYSL